MKSDFRRKNIKISITIIILIFNFESIENFNFFVTRFKLGNESFTTALSSDTMYKRHTPKSIFFVWQNSNEKIVRFRRYTRHWNKIKIDFSVIYLLFYDHDFFGVFLTPRRYRIFDVTDTGTPIENFIFIDRLLSFRFIIVSNFLCSSFTVKINRNLNSIDNGAPNPLEKKDKPQ